MKKLTIGMFCDSFFPMVDGVAMVIDNYAKRLSKIANVVVFCPKYIGKEYDDRKYNYTVVRCFSTKLPFIDYNLPAPKLDLKFEKKLNKYHLDIVHIHSPFMIGKTGIEYAEKHNIPVVATLHSQYKQDFYRAFKSKKLASLATREIVKALDRCDKCFGVNSAVSKIFYEDYGVKELPEVLNNATEMTLLKDSKDAYTYIDNLYNIKEDEKVFLFVGRINALKNIFFIVDSLKILKKKNIKYKMLFVGTGQDEEELKEKIKKEHLEDNIILCGGILDREELRKYYRRADLFLFPSLYDASSIVQIEAASQKLPGVFLKEAATAATIEDNITGFLSENNSTSYANKIIEILNNPKLYEKVKENVYKKVYVTWEDATNKLLDIYKELIKDKELEK